MVKLDEARKVFKENGFDLDKTEFPYLQDPEYGRWFTRLRAYTEGNETVIEGVYHAQKAPQGEFFQVFKLMKYNNPRAK